MMTMTLLNTTTVPFTPDSFQAVGWTVGALVAVLGLPTALMAAIYYYKQITRGPEEIKPQPLRVAMAHEGATRAELERHAAECHGAVEARMNQFARQLHEEAEKRLSLERTIREELSTLSADIARLTEATEQISASLGRLESQRIDSSKSAFERLHQVTQQVSQLAGLIQGLTDQVHGLARTRRAS